MKRILAFLLIFVLALSFVACGDDENESSGGAFTASSQAPESSEASTATGSQDDSSVVSDGTSSEASGDASGDASTDTSGTTSGDDSVTFTNKYISWNGSLSKGIVGVRASDATSIKLSKINEAVATGDVGVFTSAYGGSIKSAGQDYSEFAIAVFEYDHKAFDYVKKSFEEVGSGDASTEIPDDGYVLVIHKDNSTYINALKTAAAEAVFYPHGFTVNDGLNTEIEKTSKAPTIDGVVSKSEYGKAVWEIKPDNKLVSYAQFEVNNYYSTATVYLTYDSEYLYIGVVVDSPYHDNTCTEANASSMYNFESIQLNISAADANSDYISDHWDNVIDPVAANDNIVRQYGFCVNDDGLTLNTVWMGTDKTFTGETKCVRDDANAQTTYEIKLPFSECGNADNTISAKKGNTFGFSVSINSGNSTFKNIYLRDGGGIIGLNDWTKVPVITFAD